MVHSQWTKKDHSVISQLVLFHPVYMIWFCSNLPNISNAVQLYSKPVTVESNDRHIFCANLTALKDSYINTPIIHAKGKQYEIGSHRK